MYPENLRYSKEHEWVRVDSGNVGVVGITFFAQDQLGDVVFLNIPAVGTELKQFARLGEIESVKAVSELFAPISGKIVEINPDAVKSPELVNKDPYEKGWLLKVAIKDKAELDKLMDVKAYEKWVAAQEKSH